MVMGLGTDGGLRGDRPLTLLLSVFWQHNQHHVAKWIG